MKEDTKLSIDKYVNFGYHPGGFLRAVLATDLLRAVAEADSDDLADLREICQYIHSHVPTECWGSYKIVDKYRAKKLKELKGQ